MQCFIQDFFLGGEEIWDSIGIQERAIVDHSPSNISEYSGVGIFFLGWEDFFWGGEIPGRPPPCMKPCYGILYEPTVDTPYKNTVGTERKYSYIVYIPI